MRRVERFGTPMYVFEALASRPGVGHGVFSRHGGASKGPFASLNIGRTVGDDPGAVLKNREALARALEAPQVVFAVQVHGADVLVIDGQTPRPPDLIWNAQVRADAIVTDQPGLYCAVAVADCQPILMHDPIQGVAAAVHSGWRGSAANVAGAAVSAMEIRFSANPSDVIACVGPSLGPCCAQFVNHAQELPESFLKYKDDRDRFDFWAATRDQLKQAGLQNDNIHTAGVCTKCRSVDFFSYRRNNNTGRFAAAIGLKGVAP